MRRPWAHLLSAAALVLMPLAAEAADAPDAPGITRYVLPGGIRLLVREDPTALVVSVSLQVRSGVRYETPTTSGISNFVQRVMIRGTAKHSARQIIEVIEDIGGAVDASADAEYAEIRGSALAAHRNALLELIAEIALSPTFPPEEVERERRLIVGQIQTRAETPFSLALDSLVAQLYGPHPYALAILGQRASIERLQREDLVSHYHRAYRAGSMVVAVSGRVERNSVRREVERLLAKTPAGEIDPAEHLPAPAPASEHLVLDRPAQQAQILMGFLGPGIGEPDYAAGKVMAAILGGGMASRLFTRLRDSRGLAYSLGMLSPNRLPPGLLVAYMGTAPDTVEEAETALRQEIERFRSEGPTSGELARAKAYVLGNLAVDRRTNARQAWYLAFFELVGVGWDYPERYTRALEAVTASDVIRVAQHCLGRPVTVVVRPRP
jgi:predicted Zn-dependent peptidase